MVEILEHHSQTLKGKTARRALSFISSIIKSYSPHKTVLTPSGATDSLSCRQPSVPASILFFIVWSFPWSSETSTMLRWGKFCLLETSEQTQQHLLHSPATEGAIAAWFCPGLNIPCSASNSPSPLHAPPQIVLTVHQGTQKTPTVTWRQLS